MTLHATPFRAWINQPSAHQIAHALHGTNVLAMHEYDDVYRVYFLSGVIVSQTIPGRCLARGWVAQTPKSEGD